MISVSGSRFSVVQSRRAGVLWADKGHLVGEFSLARLLIYTLCFAELTWQP